MAGVGEVELAGCACLVFGLDEIEELLLGLDLCAVVFELVVSVEEREVGVGDVGF